MRNISKIDMAFRQFFTKIVSIYSTSARTFVLNGCVVCFLILFLTHCSPVNLISEERRQEIKPLAEEISIRQLRQEVLRNIDPSQRYRKGTTMSVTASDIWESTFIRRMTPLDENIQKFQAKLELHHQGIEYTFLNGEQKGQTIGFDGRSYQYMGTQKNYEESSSISLYLGPLQSYLEWSQTLLLNPTLQILGTKEIENIQYRVLYATEGPTQELEKYDQYLIYINTEKCRIDYIEFTMRKLMKSYKGVIHYQNHKRVQGVLMPFWIGIADDLLQPEFDHYFVVDSIKMSNPD